jgi:hypothetical protein
LPSRRNGVAARTVAARSCKPPRTRGGGGFARRSRGRVSASPTPRPGAHPAGGRAGGCRSGTGSAPARGRPPAPRTCRRPGGRRRGPARRGPGDAAAGQADVAQGYGAEQLAATGLGELALVEAVPHGLQLQGAHGPLQTQQKAVIGVGGVIDAVLVGQRGAEDAAQFQQVVSVLVRARQPAHLRARALSRMAGRAAGLVPAGSTRRLATPSSKAL